MKNRWIFTVSGVALCLVVGLAAAQAQTPKAVAVVVNAESSGWPDGQLGARMEDLIALHNGIHVSDSVKAQGIRRQVGPRFAKQAVVEAGLLQEQRFVLWCDLEAENVTIERGFAFPFLAKQRRITARLHMRYRIVDCERDRLVAADRIELRKFGPSAMQYFDFTDADPDLYLSYSGRKELFDGLEAEAAEIVAAEFKELARQR